ncbi:protein-L-isoaspartate O-methyltransferase family protein [Imhoffiella purpurea]|nr:protein-L-isoaspartate O-methyltransferase [Imhoffiella purpurea]
MEESTELARFNMIHQQIRPWGVLDERVLETMAEIPRESFVPDAYRGLAYADIEVPIGIDNCMLAPKVVGRLLQALAVKPGDKTLEIGTGSGYLSACLSRLGARVVSLEIDPVLANAARARLERLEFARIEVREADGLAGPVQGGPFEAIAVTGSMPTDAALGMLRDQLAVGGRLFCVIGEEPAMRAILVTRTSQTGFRQQALFETSLPSLLNVVEPAGFEF